MDHTVLSTCIRARVEHTSSIAVLRGLLTFLAAGAACSPVTGDQVPLTHLEEVRAVTIPDSFPVSRVEVGSGGRFALLSPLQSHLLVSSGDSLIEFGRNDLIRPVAVAFEATPQLISVIDAGRHAILLFNDGAVEQKIALDSDMDVAGAARSRLFGWVILGTAASGRRELLVENLGWKSITAHLPTSQDAAAVRFDVLITELANGSMVISERGRPHSLLFIDEDLQQRLVDVLPSHTFADSRQWVSTGLVSLEDEIIYTIADLRSDARFAILLNDKGSMIRMGRWTLPMGMAADLPDQNTILAVRHIEQRELVFYEWRRSEHY